MQWLQGTLVVHGRANSFLGAMRLVQGNRTFTPWNGSVVDSVVGVFLTHNVSDHMSSLAFMNIAATFPAVNAVIGSPMDTVDWDELRSSNVNEIARTIKNRGMYFKLSRSIKDFLNTLGMIDLEWLRSQDPNEAKNYLHNIKGLGLKSVECVSLLSLYHIGFPVDVNVTRIAGRLGWVPLHHKYQTPKSVHEYLWPHLSEFDHATLYELHYHMITFGKVFCTERNPNCSACPLQTECRHNAIARASVRESKEKSKEKTTRRYNTKQSLCLAQDTKKAQNSESIIADIEDYPWDKENKDVSTAGHRNKLKTVHYVYQLPDSHPILQGFEERVFGDVVPYLFAIWTPGEKIPGEKKCISQESNKKTCNTLRGTILIPCKTAMRGAFPLNGTFFQTNEVFADHGSSTDPIEVPRESISKLPRKIAYFGSSVSAIFKGLSMEAIENCFWRGYICVKGFNRETRTPETLVERLRSPPSKQVMKKKKSKQGMKKKKTSSR